MWCYRQDSNLGMLAYQTSAFTGLGYDSIWSDWMDSNHQPSRYKLDALTVELQSVDAEEGVEPSPAGL